MQFLTLQIACTGIFKYCLRGMLGKKQRETFFYFLDTLTSLLSESHQHGPLNVLRDQVNQAIALLERDFPISIHVRNYACTAAHYY